MISEVHNLYRWRWWRKASTRVCIDYIRVYAWNLHVGRRGRGRTGRGRDGQGHELDQKEQNARIVS